MAFGKRMWMERDGMRVTLGPLKLEHAEILAKYIQYLASSAYTMMPDRTHTVWQERDWIKKVAEDDDERIWGVYIDDDPEPIGTLGLHGLNRTPNNCVSGALFFKIEKQGCGIGSRFTHPMRTFAAFELLANPLFAIRSTVLDDNLASFKALESVGYVWTGDEKSLG